jgi:hypothetical protein
MAPALPPEAGFNRINPPVPTPMAKPGLDLLGAVPGQDVRPVPVAAYGSTPPRFNAPRKLPFDLQLAERPNDAGRDAAHPQGTGRLIEISPEILDRER